MSLRLSRFWPQSLGGQLIALLLGALAVAQIVSFWLFADERRGALFALARQGLAQRTASLVELIEATPKPLHERITQTVSSPFLSYWISGDPAVAESGDDWADRQLVALIAEELPGTREIHADVTRQLLPPPHDRREGGHQGDHEEEEAREHPRDSRPAHGWFARWREPRQSLTLNASVALADGRWLNIAGRFRLPFRSILPLVVYVGGMATAIVLIVIFSVRRLTRPLRELASAADRLGRGDDVESLEETGPAEIRGTIHAFNVMQGRLTRFVRDRTRMLAAISHDLRTPITSLRIRAEFVEDEENREKIISTLDEMQRMTEATLAFARDEASKEAQDAVDLVEYLDAIAEDYRAMGHDVAFERLAGGDGQNGVGGRVVLTCRSLSLKRAIRNLIDNAVRYGERAIIRLTVRSGEAVISISDDGPGIPPEMLTNVFEPFVRLEESRSDETGGIGLGLAIARSIVHAHGGTLTLANNEGKGLTATVMLPLDVPAR